MARPKPNTEEAWENEAYEAIVDLVHTRGVVVWAEIEARIAGTGWKDFHPAQPVQLSGARRRLREDAPLVVIEEQSGHDPPVSTLRIPFPKSGKRKLERRRGQIRKLYRKYLSWAGDEQLCGRHAETVVLASLQAAASVQGLWVPNQQPGRVTEVAGVKLSRTLDLHGWILNLDTIVPEVEVPFVVEVKNIREWIYPRDIEVWELLTKAAEAALHEPLVPILACPRNAYQTWRMAQDLGFLVAFYGNQLFRSTIQQEDFDLVVHEFGLHSVRHDEVYEPIVAWCKTLRLNPPPSQPWGEEGTPFYRRQAERFAAVAPLVLDFDQLARELDSNTRREVFNGFRARLASSPPWPLTGGW